MSSKINILNNSRRLFERYGYQKTTLSDIAKSMGKVKSAIYYYFSGKEEIFAQVVKDEAAVFLKELIEATEKGVAPVEKLELYVEARIELMQKVATRYAFLKNEFFELMSIIDKNRFEADQKEKEFVTSILKNMNDNNEISNPTFRAELLVNSIKGLEVQMYVTDELIIKKEHLKPFRDFIIYGIINK